MNTTDINNTIKKIDEALKILENIKKRQQNINKMRLEQSRKNTDNKLSVLFEIINK